MSNRCREKEGKKMYSHLRKRNGLFRKALAFSAHIMSPNTDSSFFCPLLWILNEKVGIALGWIWASSVEKVMDLKETKDFSAYLKASGTCQELSTRRRGHWGCLKNSSKNIFNVFLSGCLQSDSADLFNVFECYEAFHIFLHPLQHLSKPSDNTLPLKNLVLRLDPVHPLIC